MRWIPLRQRIQHSPRSSPRTMSRWIGLLILTLLIGFAGATRAEAPPDPAIATSKPPVTIRFVSWKPDHARVWEEVLADFARAQLTRADFSRARGDKRTKFSDSIVKFTRFDSLSSQKDAVGRP